jgi:hypothetical protein
LTENRLEAMNLPTDVNVENLTIREGRHGIDVVQDEVENQLHKVRGKIITFIHYGNYLKIISIFVAVVIHITTLALKKQVEILNTFS